MARTCVTIGCSWWRRCVSVGITIKVWHHRPRARVVARCAFELRFAWKSDGRAAVATTALFASVPLERLDLKLLLRKTHSGIQRVTHLSRQQPAGNTEARHPVPPV